MICLIGLAIFLAACACGGGKTNTSVTVPGEDGEVLKASLDEPVRARITFVRETRQVRSPRRPQLFANDHISQELRLLIGPERDDVDYSPRGDQRAFILSEHDEASSFTSHQLLASPDGEKLAVRLEQRPWVMIYVLGDGLAVTSHREFFDPIDWSKVPDIEDELVEVYGAQSLRLNGMYRFSKQTPMLAWFLRTHGEEALIEKLEALLALGLSVRWNEGVALLSDDGKRELHARLVERARGPGHPPRLYAEVLELIDIQSADAVVILENALAVFLAQPDEAFSFEHATARALRAAWAREPALATRNACGFLALPDNTHLLSSGRKVQLAALAISAASEEVCPAALSQPIDPWLIDPCAPASLCDGAPCSTEQLAAFVQAELAAPLPDTVVREEALPKLIFANFARAGRLEETRCEE